MRKKHPSQAVLLLRLRPFARQSPKPINPAPVLKAIVPIPKLERLAPSSGVPIRRVASAALKPTLPAVAATGVRPRRIAVQMLSPSAANPVEAVPSKANLNGVPKADREATCADSLATSIVLKAASQTPASNLRHEAPTIHADLRVGKCIGPSNPSGVPSLVPDVARDAVKTDLAWQRVIAVVVDLRLLDATIAAQGATLVT